MVVQSSGHFPLFVDTSQSEERAERNLLADLGIPAHEYLTAHVTVQTEPTENASPTDPEEARARSRATFARLEEKLLAEPRVLGITFAERAPRQYNGWNQIEVDGPTAPPQDERGHRLGKVSVEPDFFVDDQLATGGTGGSLGETAGLLILLCGAYLAAKRYLNWRIPASVLGTVAILAATLSANYGIYGPAYERFEHLPREQGSEEGEGEAHGGRPRRTRAP